MVTVFIAAGLGIMVLVPLVSIFLFLIGFGGLVNQLSKMEVDNDDE